jgi:geranylgeranyl diphosphate synthase type I
VKLLDDRDQHQLESQIISRLHRVLGTHEATAFQQAVIRYVLSGGKRLRPQLCVWTCLHAMNCDAIEQLDAASSDALLDLAAGWELFHAFLLVHDDIIDDSASRRGRPSMHHELAHLDGGSLQFGINLAIVAGDLLFGAAMRLWHELDCPPEVFRRELKLFSRVACTTGLGQALDIFQSHQAQDEVDQEALLREYQWKTAAYTFEGPMLSAAILAGLDDNAQAAVSRYAIALGQAYQIHNDLLDLDRPTERGCDLIQGKRTIALLRGRRLMSPAHRAVFDARLQEAQKNDRHAIELAEALRLELRSTGAIEETHKLIGDLLRAAMEAAADRALPPALGEPMLRLIHSLASRYFQSSLTIG